MRVSNDTTANPTGLEDLIRVHAEFHTRVAEETMRYLRAVQAALTPVTPSTMVSPGADEPLTAAAAPGERVSLGLDIANEQAVHATAVPTLTPMMAKDGTTWYPLAEPEPPLVLVPPQQEVHLSVGIPIPEHLPTGDYRGMVLLHGFRHEGLTLVISVGPPQPDRSGDQQQAAGASPGGAKPAAEESGSDAGAR